AARVIETEGVGQLFRLAGEDALALEDVERAIFRHSCKPRGWILGNAMVGPDFECLDQGVLRHILGKIEVLGTECTCEDRDKPAGLVAKKVVDEPLDIVLGRIRWHKRAPYRARISRISRVPSPMAGHSPASSTACS